MNNWELSAAPVAIGPGETGEEGALGGWKAVYRCPGHAATAAHRIEVEAIVIDGRRRFDHDSYADGYPYDVLVVTSRLHGDNCIMVETEWPNGVALATEVEALDCTRQIIDALSPDMLNWNPEGGE